MLAAVSVSVELALAALGVTALGENAQLKKLGRFPHDNAIALLKVPDCTAAVMVNFACCPAGSICVAGDAVSDITAGAGAGVGVGVGVGVGAGVGVAPGHVDV